MEKLLTSQGIGLLEDRKGKSEGRATPGGRITPAEGDRKNASAMDKKSGGEGMDGSELTEDSEQGFDFEAKYKSLTYDKTMEDSKFQQPRMYTIKQIRDLFYGL